MAELQNLPLPSSSSSSSSSLSSAALPSSSWSSPSVLPSRKRLSSSDLHQQTDFSAFASVCLPKKDVSTSQWWWWWSSSANRSSRDVYVRPLKRMSLHHNPQLSVTIPPKVESHHWLMIMDSTKLHPQPLPALDIFRIDESAFKLWKSLSWSCAQSNWQFLKCHNSADCHHSWVIFSASFQVWRKIRLNKSCS